MSQDNNGSSPGSIGAWDPEDYSLSSHETKPPLSLPSMHKLPSFQDFANLDAVVQLARRPSRREPSLFEQYMGSRPENILQSANEDPSRYDEHAISLLRAMYSGLTSYDKLTTTEQQLVNGAAVEFLSPTVKPKVETKKPVLRTVENQELEEGESLPIAKPIDGPVLDAFWWT